MNWRKFMAGDYPVISQWFVDHGWEAAPDLGALSTIGILVENEDGPQAVGFVYITNSPLGFLEWVATNPAGKDNITALKVLMRAVKETCKNLNVQRLFHFAGDKTKKLFQRFGFMPTETATLMLWRNDECQP